MTNPEKVYRLLKSQKRVGFCDDCVEKRTGVNRHEVNTIASTLSLFPEEFSRSKQDCPQGCNDRAKLVTAAK
jgi:hypothetical protein